MTLALESLRFWALAGAGFVAGIVVLAVLVGHRQRSLVAFRRQLRPQHDEPGAVDREALTLLAASGGIQQVGGGR